MLVVVLMVMDLRALLSWRIEGAEGADVDMMAVKISAIGTHFQKPFFHSSGNHRLPYRRRKIDLSGHLASSRRAPRDSFLVTLSL